MTAWLALALSLVTISVVAIVLLRRVDARMRQDVALDEIKREVAAIVTELNQTTERNIALIEDRISRLEELTDRADRRITALQGIEDRDRAADRTYSRLKPPSLPAEKRLDEYPADGETPALSDAPDIIQLKLGQQASSPGGGVRDAFREKVRALRRDGLGAEQIASRLGTTVGEVDLVLALDERNG